MIIKEEKKHTSSPTNDHENRLILPKDKQMFFSYIDEMFIFYSFD
jgi:hypothetical protein